MLRLPSVTNVEVNNAFLEGTTCRNLVHELVRSRPANINELFGAATNYAAGEEAVDAIFDGKMTKRKEDASVEGSSKTKTPAKKLKRGKKGKKKGLQISAVKSRRRTQTRLSPSPSTAKVPEATLGAATTCSMTCSRSRALTTRAWSTTPSSITVEANHYGIFPPGIPYRRRKSISRPY